MRHSVGPSGGEGGTWRRMLVVYQCCVVARTRIRASRGDRARAEGRARAWGQGRVLGEAPAGQITLTRTKL